MAIFLVETYFSKVFYTHGKFLYIHVKTIYSLSMRLASYQLFFFFFSCQFTCTIFIHQEGLVMSSGLTTGGVWEQTAGETTWRRTISSFHTRKSFPQVSCLFSVNAPHAWICAMATKLSYYREDLALINRAGGLYGRILTEVVSTDRTQ